MNSKRDNTKELNKEFEPLSYQERLERLFSYYASDEILITTSLGSTSAILLHILSKVNPNHPIYLINTGYLFEETIQYRDRIKEEFGLNIVDAHPAPNKHQFTQENESWKYNSDLCCFINKVEPMNELKENKKVWVSGIFRYQNANRSLLKIFEEQEGQIKFHPIIDMKKEDVSLYHQVYQLPVNKLFYQGYGSIGCHHCTSKGEGREGRWLNSEKTECGLHL